jgi:7-cyano-7-deazaguanine reductase
MKEPRGTRAAAKAGGRKAGAKRAATASGSAGSRASKAAASVRAGAPQASPVETFPNPARGRDYRIDVTSPEWTALCPITGQPDFATIRITYVPEALCLELKSLKLYLHSFRDRGVFHEAVTNEMLDHLVASCRPRRMRIIGDFRVRGGISTVVTAEFPEPGAFRTEGEPPRADGASPHV